MSTHLQVSQSDRHRTPLMSVAGYVAMTIVVLIIAVPLFWICLLYTSDAAAERTSEDLGGRRLLKKKQH